MKIFVHRIPFLLAVLKLFGSLSAVEKLSKTNIYEENLERSFPLSFISLDSRARYREAEVFIYKFLNCTQTERNRKEDGKLINEGVEGGSKVVILQLFIFSRFISKQSRRSNWRKSFPSNPAAGRN